MLLIDWDRMSIEMMREVIESISKALHDGKMKLQTRIDEVEKQGLFCSNPDCLKPLANDRAAVSSWTVNDPVTGVMRKLRACSPRCHAIIHRFVAGERVIKT